MERITLLGGAVAARGASTAAGPDAADRRLDGHRRGRSFKGEKLADLPVQAPTKYELVIKTAKVPDPVGTGIRWGHTVRHFRFQDQATRHSQTSTTDGGTR